MWTEGLTVVFAVGLVTGLATGLGVVPFFLVDEIPDRWLVALWELAAGIMLSASVFGLLAAGALLYLLFTEFVPAGLERGAALTGRGWGELGGGFGVGFVATTALVALLSV